MENPEKINGIPVVAIGNTAFYVESSIKEIKIPSTIKSIEKQALAYSRNLEKV